MSKKTRAGIIKKKFNSWSAKRQAERLNKQLIKEYLELKTKIPADSCGFWMESENRLLLQKLEARKESL